MKSDINLKNEKKYYFLGKILSMIISGIATIYLVRILTQYEFGLYHNQPGLDNGQK